MIYVHYVAIQHARLPCAYTANFGALQFRVDAAAARTDAQMLLPYATELLYYRTLQYILKFTMARINSGVSLIICLLHA